MKTTIELPDELIRAIKLRAVREDRKLKDLVAELLERALADSERQPIRYRVKLPLITGTRPAKPGGEMTPDRVAELLLQAEVENLIRLTTALCDLNVWVALAIPSHVHHSAVRGWFEGLDERRSILFCRATQQSFFRLLTTSAVLVPYGVPALLNEAAWAAYEELLRDDRVAFLAREPDGIETVWREFTARPSASPKLWMNAYLAAFARAEGARLVTTDRTFKQFASVDVLLLGSDV